MDTLHNVMSRGAYILQKDLEEFEDNIKELIGVKHVLGVADVIRVSKREDQLVPFPPPGASSVVTSRSAD